MASIRDKNSPKTGLASAMLTFSILLLSTGMIESKPFDIGSILTKTLPAIIDGLYSEDTIELFGRACQYKRIPYIKRLELHYRAEVRCLGWTPIVGKARDHRNPTNAEQGAIKDFARQALAQGLITEEESKPWLSR
ncbi:anti-lipopolysaccharide factor-like [Palaemon carinicauda]|uniref:anti-lipopolysaccharide factor-like n=1 Tax=Palaemon carinicauda TaxID=392227 RepID=UPI0035B65C89